MKKHSRVRAEINLDAILANIEKMKKRLEPDTMITAVIKADGYGHGALPAAKVLQGCDYIWGFSVATIEEAISLRSNGIGKPLLILGYVFEEDYDNLVKYQIRPTVFKREMAEQISAAAVKAGKVIPVHIAVDTGMTRIGFADTVESVRIISDIVQLPGIAVEGLFTHFARADETEKKSARGQISRYQRFLALLKDAGITVKIRHCANSAAILDLPEADLDMVRAGIAMYGIYPSAEVSREQICLEPAMELKTHITFIKEVDAGVEVSYGGTYTTKKRTRIATLPVGYADGYPRSLSGRGHVLIHGKKAPVLGRVCMDQLMVDVSAIPEARELDEVVLMGKSGAAELTVEELGRLSGRFPYEFVCDIGKRVPRVYYQKGEIVGESECLNR